MENLNNIPKCESCCNDPINAKLSVISVVCRICYDNEKDEALIAPCKCKGTVAFVHRSCLETWLAESNTTKCELCNEIIHTERTPKYTSTQSVWHWCWYSPRVMGHAVRGDIIACTLITPLAIVITYVCLFSSEYYNQKKFATVPAARWTSVSLLVMIVIMLFGYYLWVYSVIRMNARLWYNWWQRACIVRYIPPDNLESGGSQNIATTPTPQNTPNSNATRGVSQNTNTTNSSGGASEEGVITRTNLGFNNNSSRNKTSTVVEGGVTIVIDEDESTDEI